MMHEPLPREQLEQLVEQFASTAALSDVHVLYRDYETRSCALLKKVGLYKYATDPSTELRVVVYAVDDGPMQLWPLGNPPQRSSLKLNATLIGSSSPTTINLKAQLSSTFWRRVLASP
jgi:hypothetical protein